MVWRSLLLQASFNYERMQAGGWLYSILPGLKKIHKNKEDLSNSMKLHLEFFNVHPFLVTFVQGLVLAMEENKVEDKTEKTFKERYLAGEIEFEEIDRYISRWNNSMMSVHWLFIWG